MALYYTTVHVLSSSVLHYTVADPDIPFRGGDEMRLNAKGTVGSFQGRNLIYNKIIGRGGGGGARSASIVHSHSMTNCMRT